MEDLTFLDFGVLTC